MAGSSNITGDESIIFADNASFDGTERGGKMTTDGQLWIGSTASPHVKRGTITSPLGTLSIGYSSPNLTLDVAGGAAVVQRFAMQTGTSPVGPAAGIVTFNGAVVAAGTNPVRTDGTGANTMALEVQISQALAAADATKIGLSNFDSSSFAVAATGFVTLSTTGAGKTITGNSGGALSPTANNWNIFGASTAAGVSPVATSGSASTLTVNVQKAQAIAATDATKVGLANFDSSKFTVDANGFVSTSGTGIGNTITGQSGGALAPTAGNWNISGASTAAGTSPVVTSGSGSTLTVNVQKSQAIASTDATKIGLAAFDSASFTVDANGWVQFTGTAFTWNDVTGTSASMAVSNGYLADNAGLVTLTLPSTAVQFSIIEVKGYGAGGWKIAQNANQKIIFGNQATTVGVGGSLASTNANDGVKLIAAVGGASTFWTVLSGVGNITVV